MKGHGGCAETPALRDELRRGWLQEQKSQSGFCFSDRAGPGFPGGSVVKNPPDKAGGDGSTPDLGRSRTLWSH